MELVSECCVNHQGFLDVALEMIRMSKACGCSIIKFQFYYPDILCADRNCFDAYKLLDKVKLRPQWLPILADECKRKHIEFLCTGFCKYSIEQIAPYVSRFKIASPEVTVDFVKHVSSYGKPIIISNGKASQETLDAIFDAVKVPITLLLCVSKYPAEISDYDLRDMDKFRKRYGCKVGLSDHTQSLALSIEAAKRGADMIERHFTLTKNTPDECVSLYPQELLKLSQILREVRNG
jgi:sialic acid synthase SpsE